MRNLREAYLKALKEPEVVTEANKRELDLEVLSGDELEVSMREVINQSREVVERVKRLIEANP